MSFDLDISHYDKNELEDLLQLKSGSYNHNDIKLSIEKLRKNVLANKTVNDSLKSRTANFLLVARDKLVGFIEGNNYTLYNNNEKIDSLNEHANHFIMEKKSENVNFIDRKKITNVINIDSVFRDNLSTTPSTNFSVILNNNIKKCVKMELSMFESPSKTFNISRKIGNNYFHYQDKQGNINKIIIPDGYYNSIVDIKAYLETHYNLLTFNYFDSVEEFNDNGNQLDNSNFKLLIKTPNSNDIGEQVNGKLIFNFDENGNVSNTSFHQKLGYLLGFRTPEIYFNYDENGSHAECRAQSVPDIDYLKYFFLAVDDFQNNVSSTFGSSSINQNMEPNVLARISFVNEKLGRLISFNGDNKTICPTRKYFGPCDIQRLNIRLVDKYGRELDTDNNDFSFALTFESLYE
tara:strand:- start:15247 stop:16461 length:1215 start_codon:yes stop_codon:yes gene_type:complete